MLRVKVEGQWSKYFSYMPWSFGRQNKSLNDSDKLAELSTDEVIVLNDKLGTHFQFKVILKRNKTTTISPKLSLVSITLTIPNYKYEVDVEGLPLIVDYDVLNLINKKKKLVIVFVVQHHVQ